MNVVNSNKNNLCEQIEQAMHDIRSPLACLKMLNRILTNVSEQDKLLLDNSTQRITRIIDSLDGAVNSYSKNKISNVNEEVINVHSIIEKILIEKKNEYHELNIYFSYSVQENSRDLLISGSTCDFERMLSNIINNAVDACNDNTGKITINLSSDDYYLYLEINDNGKGMPDEVLEKLRSNIAITHGKENGHGIGYKQIRETVKQIKGELAIDSKIGVGSTVSLKIGLSKNLS